MTVDTVRLGTLVADGRVSYGIVQPGSARETGVPVVRAGDIRGGRIDVLNPLRVTPEASARHSRTVLRGGELLFSVVGTVGETAIVPYELAGWNVARAVAVLRPDGVSTRWLEYALQSPNVKRQIDSYLNTTVQPTLNLADLTRLILPHTPVPEQQAIAEVLGALDDKIAANSALAATADLYASTVLLGSLGTGRVRLDSIAHITMGSSPKGDTLNELGQGVPFYQGVRDFGFRSPSRRVFTTAPARSANAGDILVSVRAPVGDVNVADEPVCIGRGIAAVRSTRGTQATLLHQLKAERDAWAPFEAEGTVFGSINRDQLHGIQLNVVAPKRVEFVEQELAGIESSIAATLAENRTLAATRDALLPQLMSGKLRVRDIDRAASGVEA